MDRGRKWLLMGGDGRKGDDPTQVLSGVAYNAGWLVALSLVILSTHKGQVTNTVPSADICRRRCEWKAGKAVLDVQYTWRRCYRESLESFIGVAEGARLSMRGSAF